MYEIEENTDVVYRILSGGLITSEEAEAIILDVDYINFMNKTAPDIKIVTVIEHEKRRWSFIQETVFKIGDRYFIVESDEPLTEYQERTVNSQIAIEVEPHEVTTIEWRPK